MANECCRAATVAVYEKQLTNAYCEALWRLWYHCFCNPAAFLKASRILRDQARPHTEQAINAILRWKGSSISTATAAGLVATRSVDNFVDRMWVLVGPAPYTAAV